MLTLTPPERIDWRAIKDRINLEAVCVALLGEPQGRGGSRGLWWRCPFHDDRNPSLHVDPDRRRWKCWGCGRHGDAVELVMGLDPSLSFSEAVHRVAELGGVNPMGGASGRAAQRFVPKTRTAAARPVASPSGLPLENALSLVADAAERLWRPEGAQALSYLHGRGLTDVTIRNAELGYVRDVAIPTRDGDRSYRASGISIPWFDGDRLALVKIRQLGDRKPKYVEAYRDSPRVFPSRGSIRPGRPLVVVEGEFDSLLLQQQIGDVACVVTLGSASNRTADDIRRIARACPSLFAAHDRDDAGDQAAARWPARAVRVKPPDGSKDWTEAHATGFNRIRYLWGKHLQMSMSWEELKSLTWGSDAPDPDPDGSLERLAIQEETANMRTIGRMGK